MSNFTDVRLWMKVAGQPVRTEPISIIPKPERDLRFNLIEEEYKEFKEGVRNANLIEIADGLADILVVTYGTAVAYGIDADAVFSEAMRANWTKFEDGVPVFREDGKVMKGRHYIEPDIARVLREGV